MRSLPPDAGVTTVEARGTVVTLPVDPVLIVDARDPATQLLAELVEVQAEDAVLVVGGGSGLLPVVAARLAGRGRVTVACGQVTVAAQVEAAVALSGLANVEVVRSADLSALRGRAFDVALLGTSLVADAAVLRRGIAGAALLLRPGGRCYLAGGKREGVLSAAGHLEAVLGNARTLGYRKGHRVVAAARTEQVQATWERPPARVAEVTLRGRTYAVATREGVFAGGELDEGTRLLAEALEVRPRDVALDLGCGSGLIGLVAADLAPEGRVYLVDSDLAACDLARENVERHGAANAVVVASDAFAALGDLRFDVVATNPPFHVGRLQTTAVADRFVGGAARHLRPGGRLYLVANRFLRYEPVVEAAFGDVRVATQTSRYKVLLAEAQRSR